ncbi:uncharacterized protein B0H18DRAFT_367664 [Fomitopsis serialis]|uniref:uncharacterized protein n=1 Tax=Fomitopsis serialis TaxID=139415 RepID=UPI0020073CEF|nr:uncharacterized protein B0H18DRAFT_367664 [Neoantrodia serialis]KAH9925788.1 hypothetical protein B0H18DRAFT_367664 [Neoantrodia serialis]
MQLKPESPLSTLERRARRDAERERQRESDERARDRDKRKREKEREAMEAEVARAREREERRRRRREEKEEEEARRAREAAWARAREEEEANAHAEAERRRQDEAQRQQEDAQRQQDEARRQQEEAQRRHEQQMEAQRRHEQQMEAQRQYEADMQRQRDLSASLQSQTTSANPMNTLPRSWVGERALAHPLHFERHLTRRMRQIPLQVTTTQTHHIHRGTPRSRRIMHITTHHTPPRLRRARARRPQSARNRPCTRIRPCRARTRRRPCGRRALSRTGGISGGDKAAWARRSRPPRGTVGGCMAMASGADIIGACRAVRQSQVRASGVVGSRRHRAAPAVQLDRGADRAASRCRRHHMLNRVPRHIESNGDMRDRRRPHRIWSRPRQRHLSTSHCLRRSIRSERLRPRARLDLQ